MCLTWAPTSRATSAVPSAGSAGTGTASPLASRTVSPKRSNKSTRSPPTRDSQYEPTCSGAGKPAPPAAAAAASAPTGARPGPSPDPAAHRHQLRLDQVVLAGHGGDEVAEQVGGGGDHPLGHLLARQPEVPACDAEGGLGRGAVALGIVTEDHDPQRVGGAGVGQGHV